MKLKEAQKMAEAGLLKRRVMTEEGWFVPDAVKPPEAPAAPKRRGRPKRG